jgi:regulator of sigma E protease
LVFLAGPTMNYLSAVVLIAIALMTGYTTWVEAPVLGYVPPKTLAAQAGLVPEDLIEAVDGKPVTAFSDLEGLYDRFLGEKDQVSVLTVKRGGKGLSVTLSGRLGKEGPALGLSPKIPPVIGQVALMTPGPESRASRTGTRSSRSTASRSRNGTRSSTASGGPRATP